MAKGRWLAVLALSLSLLVRGETSPDDTGAGTVHVGEADTGHDYFGFGPGFGPEAEGGAKSNNHSTTIAATTTVTTTAKPVTAATTTTTATTLTMAPAATTTQTTLTDTAATTASRPPPPHPAPRCNQDKVFGECGPGIMPNGENATCCSNMKCAPAQPGAPPVCIVARTTAKPVTAATTTTTATALTTASRPPSPHPAHLNPTTPSSNISDVHPKPGPDTAVIGAGVGGGVLLLVIVALAVYRRWKVAKQTRAGYAFVANFQESEHNLFQDTEKSWHSKLRFSVSEEDDDGLLGGL